MIALLTQESGDVVVTDAAGVNHTLPSFMQLSKSVTGLTDDLTGAVAETRALAALATNSATQASHSADEAAASAASIEGDVESAATSADVAGRYASLTTAAASAASGSATSAEASASAAYGSAVAASASKDNAGFSAEAAKTYRDDAASSKDTAALYANAPVNIEVTPGHYSAFHWAEQARLTATGALIYRGAFNASAGSYPPIPRLGDLYLVSTAGTVGGVKYGTGDMMLYDGDKWDRIDNQQTVTSVAGRTGAVTLSASDISGLQALLDSKASLSGAVFTSLAMNKGSGISMGPSDSVYLYDSDSSGSLGIRTGTGGAYRYFTFSKDGTLVVNNGGVSAVGLRAGDWVDVSSNSTGRSLLGNNAYLRTDDSTFRYRMTHGTMGASGLYFPGFGGAPKVFYSGVAATADQAFTPTMYDLWHSGNFDPSTKANTASPSFTGTMSVAGAVKTNVGAPGTQQIFSSACWNNGIQRWNFVLESSGGFSIYCYNSSGGNPYAIAAFGVAQAGDADLIRLNTHVQVWGTTFSRDRLQVQSANGARWVIQSRTFVQAADPGAEAQDGDLWIW